MTKSQRSRHLDRALVALLACTGAVAVCAPEVAHAGGLTLSADIGSGYVLHKDNGISGRRLPTNFEVGPGYQWKRFRLELPIVLAIDEEGTVPRASHTFYGLRPQAKFFPLSWLYGKLAAHVFVPSGGDKFTKSDVYFGCSIGGGVEITFANRFAINGELNWNPLFGRDSVVPIEFRGGATVRF